MCTPPSPPSLTSPRKRPSESSATESPIEPPGPYLTPFVTNSVTITRRSA
jgi:hypothetical protein